MRGDSESAPLYVVLVNFNGWRNTIECLETVLRSDHAALRVMVLDNGSTDGSIDQLRAWAEGRLAAPTPQGSLASLAPAPVPKPVRVLTTTRVAIDSRATLLDWSGASVAIIDCAANLGFAGANNVALRYVLRAERDAVALLLNNDTVVAPAALSAMMTRVSDSTAVGATLLQYYVPDRVETLGGATVSMWSAMSQLIGWDAPRAAPRGSVGMDFISGCCLMMTRQVIERVGLLDERFFIYSEDTDWGVRARGAGIRLDYARDAEVWHKGSSTSVARSTFHDYHTTKSAFHFVRKHRRALLFPVSLPFILARFGLPKIVRRQWDRVGAVRRGLVDFWAEAVAAPKGA